jgi:hypothetical protein
MSSRNISRYLETDYGVSLAGLKRKQLTDFAGSRIEQLVFPDEETGHGVYNDAAENEIKSLQLQSRQKRDMALDFYNPKEELPHDVTAERIVDQIPDWKPQVVDLSRPGDYEAHEQVRLVQDARANYIRNSTMFDDPNFQPSGESDGARGVSATAGYDLGAAGIKTNHFVDEDGTPTGVVENVQAF